MNLYTQAARNIRSAVLYALGILAIGTLAAQTNPAPQQLPHTQSFSATAHGNTTYPTGWQGWLIGNGASTVYEVGAPNSDLALIANSTAAANSGGLHNYNGALGMLNSVSTNAALVLSIVTSNRFAIQVDYTLLTIRNPYNGTTNTRRNEATLQYRVGTTGPFTTLWGATYATGTTTQTGAVTTPIDPVPFSRTLPAECDYQPLVQVRWVVRDSIGVGARPSIAVDNVSVNGTWSPMYVGGIGRGEASNAYQAPVLASSIFNGGNGRGDVSNGYTAPLLATSIYSGGNGRGDVSFGYSNPLLASSIFSGGNGRGDVMNSYLVPLRVQLALKGFLEGAYDQVTNRMRDDLRNAALIPTTEPYSALGYGFVEGGGETVLPSVLGTTPAPKDRIVDWVMVELRDANDPTVVVSSRCALVQRDGDVVDLDGSSPVQLAADPAAYHVVLRHRNHLGAMTANTFALGTTPTSIDLTLTNTPMHGTQALKDIGTVRALWAGDVFGDGQLKYTGAYNDRDPILSRIGGTVATNVISGIYSSEDVNLDGQVMYTGTGNDRDPILVNIGGTIATNVRDEQLP